MKSNFSKGMLMTALVTGTVLCSSAAAFAEELQERLQSLQNSKNGYLYKLKSRSEKQAEVESRQRNSEKLAGEKLQRAQVLSDLEKNYESFNNSVKFVMKQAGAGALRGVVGPVSSLIKTKNRYSTAVEIALGAAIQNIVVQDEGAAKRAIALLGGKIERVYEYPIQDAIHKAVVIRKVSPTPPKYPRAFAKIKKSPL